MPLIPSKINLLPELKGYNAIERPMKTILREGQFGVLYGRLKAKLQHKRYHRSLKEPYKSFDKSGFQYVADCVEPYLKSLYEFGTYDLAISFLHPHNIVLNKVKAQKKIAWIHTDYSTVHVNANKELRIWGKYDYIASISPDCTSSFLKSFPSLKDKIIEIENILSPEFIRHQASLLDVREELNIEKNVFPLNKKDKCLNIISIGRFCYQKNFESIPFIASKLMDLLSQKQAENIVNQGDLARTNVKERYTDLRWYLIGFGSDESLILNKIKETGMQEHVIILGKRFNPYPYIKACDLYVQPSRYEGKSVTVREAQILHKPVIVTNYPTAPSQIKNGVDGVIVPMDNEGCAQGIIDFICNERLQNNIIDFLNSHDYGNECEVEKIYSLL